MASSRTIRVRWYKKGKTSLHLNEARDDGVLGCSGISWTICKQSARRSRQITTPTPHHSVFTGRMLFLMPNQQCQSTEGNKSKETNTGNTPIIADQIQAIWYIPRNGLYHTNCSLRYYDRCLENGTFKCRSCHL